MEEETVPQYVYIIYSEWILDRIINFVREMESPQLGVLGPIRIDYDKDGTESNRTLCTMSPLLARELLQRHGSKSELDFRIALYELRSSNYPPEGCGKKFYIPIPHDLGLTVEDVEMQVNDKIKNLIPFGIIGAGDWSLKIPLITRKDGVMKGSCFVIFTPQVSLHQAASMKVIIDSTEWYCKDGTTRRFRCYWAQNRRNSPRGKRHKFSRSSSY